jgi:hypothetical protein
VPLAALFLLLSPAPRRTRLVRASLFWLGLAATLGPVVMRIHRLEGAVIPGHIASTHPRLADELAAAAIALLGRYAGIHPVVELPLLLLAIGLLLALLIRRRDLAGALRDVVAGGPRRLPVVWACASVAFLLLIQQSMYVESTGARYILPAGLLLLLPAGFLAERALRPGPARVTALVLGILALKVAAELVLLQSGAIFRPADPVAASARLSWIARETSDHDLILGDDTMDVPFHLGRSAAVSFSPAPAPTPDYELFRDVCRAHAAGHGRFYIVLRNNYAAEADWRRAYGPFIADLVQDRLAGYPGIERVARLEDGHVFAFHP